MVRLIRVAILPVLLVVGANVGVFPSNIFPTVSNVHATTDSVNLQGNFQAWNFSSTNPAKDNPIITVHQGDTLSLLLVSRDGNTHQFLVDVDKDGGSLTDDCPSVDQCSSFFGGSGFPAQTSYSFPVNFPAGNYTYYCSIHFSSMLGIFQVLPDFSLAASPTAAGVVAGGSSSFTVSLTSLGFSGTVGLTSFVPAAATGVTVSLNPSSVALISGGTGTSILKVSTSLSSPSGTFLVTVTGSSGSLSHTTGVMVTITGGTVGGAVQPVSQSVVILTYLGLVASIAIALAVSTFFFREFAKPERLELGLLAGGVICS